MLQENAVILQVNEMIESVCLTNDQPNKKEIVYLDINSNTKQQKPENALTDSPSTKSNSKSNEYNNKVRVGSEFQAICPPLIPVGERDSASLPEKALTIWKPKEEDAFDSILESYISLAYKKFGYNIEQALAMLYWHKYDIQTAIADLDKFTPFPDDWTREDKIIFEDALLCHGKNFVRIREFLPDKSVGGLIDYYYRWKKRRGRQHGGHRRGRPRAEKRELPAVMNSCD